MISSYAAFEEYINGHNKYLAMVYDLDDILSLELSSKYIITNDVAKAKKDIILLNVAEISGEFPLFASYFHADSYTFSTLVNNNSIEKTIDYHIDGSELGNMVSSL